MAGNNLKFFMRSLEPEIVSAPAPDSFRDNDGNPFQLEIRRLSSKEIRDIYAMYRRRSVSLDPHGQPLISNGEVVFQTENDNDRATRHILAEALQFPNLKDPELMKFYHCVDITDMPQLVFSRPEEYAYVSKIVLSALGIINPPDTAALIAQAKN